MDFIDPKPRPCGRKCESYNESGQCPECGWLIPMEGDEQIGLRESPLGPPVQLSIYEPSYYPSRASLWPVVWFGSLLILLIMVLND